MSDVKAMAFQQRKFLKRASALGSLALWLLCGCAKPLPVLGEVPEFSLLDQSAATVTKKDLEGSVWVADFIYTGCGSACPLLTQRLSEFGKRVPRNDSLRSVKLVSFTVDPETDTPERLKEYAERFGASRETWLFLTGPIDQIQKTATEGFKLAYQKTDVDLFHSEKLVVIDAFGRIRGYFDADPNGLKGLQEAVAMLRDRTSEKER